MNKHIYLTSPHMCGKEREYVEEAFNTNWIAPLGPHVDAFEKKIAEYVGLKSAVALISGTAAIHLALRYIGVKQDDYIFCSSFTFVGSCNPIIYQNAIPVFIDSEPESWNMSLKALKAAFNWSKMVDKLPKAVIVVNLYGQSANMDKIKDICDDNEVPIIEDAAESLGARYKGKMSGTFGKLGIFSFNGNKIITTSGGGMLVSNDKEAIRKTRFWATQARDPARHYEHSELGYNYRMSNICAGIGRGQLTVLNKRITQKKAIFKKYKKAFSKIDDIEMMPIAPYGQPNYWLSVITIKEKSIVKPMDIILELEKNNIESRPVWKPMHLQPYYKDFKFFNYQDKKISIAEDIFNRGLCLPSDTKMTEKELNHICEIISNLF